MFTRYCFRAAVALCLVLPLAGCSNTDVSSIQISPSTSALTVGQTVQFSATGIVQHGSHPASSSNVTAQATWSSSTPAVATVNSSGMATAVSAGTVTITATLPGSISATATITVTGGGGTTGGSLASLAIIPGTQSVASPAQTSQFIAIGTTTSGATEDLTSTVTWSSSSTQVATITAGGLATAVSKGTTTVTAIAANPDSSVVTATATFTVTGGTAEPLTALAITPGTQSVSASGQTGQFIALGTEGSSGLQENVSSSSQLKWISSTPSLATVSASGLVTGVAVGSSTITALWTNPDASVVSATATVTVTSTAAPEPLLSLTIIPSVITVGNLMDTGNFLAIGTYSTAPYTRDVTNSVAWLSSEPDYFPVDTDSTPPNPGAPAGLVTAYSAGSAVIIAEATDPTTGSIQTATATFNCPYLLPAPPSPGSCAEPGQLLLATVTVYNEGLNQSNWLVTAPSATGTPNVIHCGPGSELAGLGGSVCVATYPLGTTVTFTATQQPGGTGSTTTFGGWSSTCTIPPATYSPDPSSATGPNTCTIIPTYDNETVGAIFN
jgi:uncharacterized protein YjdB